MADESVMFVRVRLQPSLRLCKWLLERRCVPKRAKRWIATVAFHLIVTRVGFKVTPRG